MSQSRTSQIGGSLPQNGFQLPSSITPRVSPVVSPVVSLPTMRTTPQTTIRTPVLTNQVRSPVNQRMDTSLAIDAPSRKDDAYQRFLVEFTRIQYQDMVKEPDGAFIHENTLGLQWNNPQAIQRAHQVMIGLNRAPDAVNPNAEGIAIWQKVPARTGGIYHSYEIRDDVIAHLKPVLHGDYFIVRLYRTLKSKTVKKLSLITHSTWYENTTGVIAAECHFLGAALVTFAVIKMVDMGKIDLPDARHMYDQLIGMVAKEWTEAEKLRNPRDAQAPIHDALERFIMSED